MTCTLWTQDNSALRANDVGSRSAASRLDLGGRLLLSKVTLREHLELRIAELEHRLINERALIVEAARAREVEVERRLAMLNELRAEVISDRALFAPQVAFDTLRERVNGLVTRDYYDQQHRALADKVDVNVTALAEARREISNIRSRNAGYAAALGLALTILTIIMIAIQFAGHHV